MTTGVALVCMVWAGAWASSAGARPSAQEKPGQGVELAFLSGEGEGQSIVTVGDMNVNIEAYNRKREKDIADASRKLLSLAIALKSDLDQNAGSGRSPDAVSKAKQIEKLAHDVKESMKLNLVGPR